MRTRRVGGGARRCARVAAELDDGVAVLGIAFRRRRLPIVQFLVHDGACEHELFRLLADIIIHEWLGGIIDDNFMYKYEFILHQIHVLEYMSTTST